MEPFSYLCRHCGKSILIGSEAHLLHVRHGKVIGEVEGKYNGQGTVEKETIFGAGWQISYGEKTVEIHLDLDYEERDIKLQLLRDSQNKQRNFRLNMEEGDMENINSFHNIQLSSGYYLDSAHPREDLMKKRLFQGIPCSLYEFAIEMTGRDGTPLKEKLMWAESIDELKSYLREAESGYYNLPKNHSFIKPFRKSGIVAFHKRCFEIAKSSKKGVPLTPSSDDPYHGKEHQSLTHLFDFSICHQEEKEKGNVFTVMKMDPKEKRTFLSENKEAEQLSHVTDEEIMNIGMIHTWNTKKRRNKGKKPTLAKRKVSEKFS